MRMRAVFGILVWTSTVVGAVRLLGHARVLGGAGVGILIVVNLLSALARRRRLRVWNGSGEPAFPPGPRRVLLIETGLAGPTGP